MMRLNNQFEQSSEGNSIVRTLLFIIISAVAIISSLIILLYNSKNLDKKINKCISENTELITTSQNLLFEIDNSQRRILALALITNKSQLVHINQERELAISKSQKYHDKIIKHIESNSLLPKLSHNVKKSISLRSDYIEANKEFLILLKQDTPKNKISHYLSKKLGPTFKKYRLNQLKISESLNNQFITESQNITKKSSRIVWLAFFIGISPFLFLFKILLNPKKA